MGQSVRPLSCTKTMYAFQERPENFSGWLAPCPGSVFQQNHLLCLTPILLLTCKIRKPDPAVSLRWPSPPPQISQYESLTPSLHCDTKPPLTPSLHQAS